MHQGGRSQKRANQCVGESSERRMEHTVRWKNKNENSYIWKHQHHDAWFFFQIIQNYETNIKHELGLIHTKKIRDQIFFSNNFLKPRCFGTNLFLSQIFFSLIFLPKFILVENFLEQKLSWT